MADGRAPLRARGRGCGPPSPRPRLHQRQPAPAGKRSASPSIVSNNMSRKPHGSARRGGGAAAAPAAGGRGGGTPGQVGPNQSAAGQAAGGPRRARTRPAFETLRNIRINRFGIELSVHQSRSPTSMWRRSIPKLSRNYPETIPNQKLNPDPTGPSRARPSRRVRRRPCRRGPRWRPRGPGTTARPAT